MLARHLLFLATRRPYNALMPFPGETAPSQATSQTPPPYVGPPKPRDWQNVEKSVDYSDKMRYSQKKIFNDAYQRDYKIYEDNRTSYEQSNENRYPSNIRSADNRRNSRTIDSPNQPYYEPPRYSDNRRMYTRDIVKTENERNQQFCDTRIDGKQQFFTLPTRRPARDSEPPRSVTPDITRGLGRCPLSAMHILARHGRKPIVEGSTGQGDSSVDSNKRSSVEQMQMQGRSRLVENFQQPTNDARNRFIAPLGLSALGYRFFASSPVHEIDGKSTEILRNSTISPIATRNCANDIKSSTPTTRSNPTVAERLTLIGNNCPSPISGSSGRNTPTNLSIISPTRSTMSNDELFAAIHKSKRRLNIKDDAESLSPASSTSSLVKAQAGTRHSWSPESQKTPEIPPTVQSPSGTSRLDFKRLLLQQSVKTGPTRLSAAEQLKLSRQQCNQQQHQLKPQQPQYHQQQQQQQQQQYHQSIPQNVQQVPLAKVLSPRSVWRFQTPRTDVLSSTIIEDSAAEEKAMKPSPENSASASRLNSRRQLDLDEKLPDRLARNGAHSEKTKNRANDVSCSSQPGTERLAPSSGFSPNQRIATTNADTIDGACDTPNTRNLVSIRQRLSVPCGQNSTDATKFRSSNGGNPMNRQITGQNVIASRSSLAHNYENRRINNQLARAQFLAGVSSTSNDNNNSNESDNQRQSAYYEKRFRARSESPKPTIAQSVTRSPSAPTLETAL